MKLEDKALVDFTSKLIQIPSPSGKEKELAEFIVKMLKALDFEEIRIDEMGNVIACIKGKREGKTVLLDGHMDTVEALEIEKWKHPPYEGKVTDDKVYGRGASDMKGSIASMIFAIARFAKETNRNFSGKVYIACTVFEEIFEGVSCQSIERVVKPDYVIIGEATSSTLKIGQRGRAEISIKTIGKTVHSSNPQEGINAVQKMNSIMNKVNKIKPEVHPVLGEGISEITDIISSPYPGNSMVPEECRLTIDRRLLVGESKEKVLHPFIEIIENLSMEDPEFKGEVDFAKDTGICYTGKEISSERFYPAWLLNEEDDIVIAAKKGLENAGLEAKISHYSFCTNGSYYCGIKGIPTIGYGPSLEELAHIRDEYIAIEELTKSCKGFQGIISELLNLDMSSSIK